MNAKIVLLAAASLIAATPAIAQPAHAPAAAQTADARLRQLFHDSDEATLRRNPIQGMFRGDYRYAAHLGDYITDAYFAGERAAAEHDLAVLRAIPRAALSPTDRLAYDVFKFQREIDLTDVQPAMLALTAVRPLNHFSGFQTFYPVFASAHGAAPFRNVEDYDNNLTRHREYAHLIDLAIGPLPPGPSPRAWSRPSSRSATSSSSSTPSCARRPRARLITSRCSISPTRCPRPTGRGCARPMRR